jgi:nucleoside-specific channel-forming protein
VYICKSGEKDHPQHRRPANALARTPVRVFLGAVFAATGAAHAQDASVASAGPTTEAAVQIPAAPASEYYLHSTLSVINSSLTRFGPFRTGNLYGEYEYYGHAGPLDFFGYVDFPKIVGVGSKHSSGMWDQGGTYLFSEALPRLSIDRLLGQNWQFGPFQHLYVAADWIYNFGHNRSTQENTLYYGIGTDIKTGTPLSFSANLYAAREFQNFGAANEYSWDGYRAQLEYFYPIGHYLGGDWMFSGYFNWDFGSRLVEDGGGPLRTDTAFVDTNAITYSRGHLRLQAVARYFHNGGQWNGVQANFGAGPFQIRSTGWGYYLTAGLQF